MYFSQLNRLLLALRELLKAWDANNKDKPLVFVGINHIVPRALDRDQIIYSYTLERLQQDHTRFLDDHKDNDIFETVCCFIYLTQRYCPKESAEIISAIFADIPPLYRAYVADTIYTHKLTAIDVASLSPEILANIVDEYKVGTGNVIIDLIIRTHNIGVRQPIPGFLLQTVVDLLPKILEMSYSQAANPYDLDPAEKCHPQYYCPLYPKIIYTPSPFVDSQDRSRRSRARLRQLFACSKELYREIFLRSIVTDAPNPWAAIFKANYLFPDTNAALLSELSAEIEQIFLNKVGEHYDANPEQYLEHLKFTLNLAREFFLKYALTQHLDYVAVLTTTDMNKNQQFCVNDGSEDTLLTGNPNKCEFIKAKVQLPDTPEANAAFSLFLQQISYTEQPIPKHSKMRYT